MSAGRRVREKLASLSPDVLRDRDEWFKLLEEFGFNDENPHELPESMLSHPGFGLRIWQYPNQFAPYMAWLASNALRIHSYLEIGVRHGGTFVTHVETLRRLNPSFRSAVAVDLIRQSELLRDYEYRQDDSQSAVFKDWIGGQFFDLVFIDGDHSYGGVANDATLTINRSNIQVFHDIASDACPDVRRFWRDYQETHGDTHDFVEFVDQYDSVNGSFLGIGVAFRREWFE